MYKSIFIGILYMMGSGLYSQTLETKNTTILWDTSVSMQDRDLEKDFSVLERVFTRTPDQDVQLVLFNITTEEKEYEVRAGNWEAIKKDLSEEKYDGANVYAIVNERAKYPNIYLFTDGNRIFEDDAPILPKNSFIINSSPNRDEEFLKRTALINRNRLMDFAAILPENIGGLKKPKTQERSPITGKVYIDNIPVANVTVAVRGMPGGVVTEGDGSFSIEAQPSDSLLLTSRAKNTMKVVPVDKQKELTIFLEANVVSLEEVVLVEKQQSKFQTESVITGFGQENKDKVGYAVQTIDDEDISPIQTDVSQSVQSKFSNVTLGNTEDISQATVRSNTSILGNNYSLVVIDGVPQRQSDSSSGASANNQANFGYINPDNIASISVLKGYAATTRYGSLGANGVILITTKSAQGRKAGEPPQDLARLTDNIYTENAIQTSIAASEVQKSLEKASNEKEAYSIYLSLRSNNIGDINLYMEVFDYFKTVNRERAAIIISNILELFPTDISTLRAVSLALSATGFNDDVIRINNEILSISKDNIQSYLDIALAQRANAKYQDALKSLLDLERGVKYPTLNLSGISKTLNREARNLVFSHKDKLNTSNVDTKYFNNLKYNVRMVFEWNHPEAEFNLQFVNPQKRYFNWEHTNLANPERIRDEIINGYTSEEFEFYGDGVEGKWIINATYLGNLDVTNQIPLVLRCTLYQNFGYPDQTQEELIVHFSTSGETKQLKTLFVK